MPSRSKPRRHPCGHAHERRKWHGHAAHPVPLAERNRYHRAKRRAGGASRVGLRVEQVDEERGHRKARDGGGDVDHGAQCGACRARDGPGKLHAHVEAQRVSCRPRVARGKARERDAIGLLGVAARNCQRLASPKALEVRSERRRVERKARGDGRHRGDDGEQRRPCQPEVAHHELTAAGEKRETKHKVHERRHSGLGGQHAAGKSYGNVGEHDRPSSRQDLLSGCFCRFSH